MLIGIVCQQITILVSIPLSIVVLMYICSVSSGARPIMLLYSVLHCACIQLLKNIYMKDYLLLYAFCCEFFSCRSDWIPSLCQLLPQVEIAIEGCSQFKFLCSFILPAVTDRPSSSECHQEIELLTAACLSHPDQYHKMSPHPNCYLEMLSQPDH